MQVLQGTGKGTMWASGALSGGHHQLAQLRRRERVGWRSSRYAAHIGTTCRPPSSAIQPEAQTAGAVRRSFAGAVHPFAVLQVSQE